MLGVNVLSVLVIFGIVRHGKGVLSSKEGNSYVEASAGLTPTTEGEFPYHVLIRVQSALTSATGFKTCGGAGIGGSSPFRVITAASCFYEWDSINERYLKSSPANVTVYYGSIKKNGGNHIISSTVRIHQDYDPNVSKSENDIAIIQLQRRLPFGSSVTYPRNNSFVPADSICTLTGWGRQSSDDSTLLKADLKVSPKSNCSVAYHYESNEEGKLPNSVMCAEGNGKTHSCAVDFGGPLVCKNSNGKEDIAGILSRDSIERLRGNCITLAPSIFTRTAEIHAWISQTLRL